MKRKRGFTLVELSIVLVIIGLLIGGILAAQSMISTAKINSVAMQIGQFDAGVENFKTKYNALPGDAPAFGGNGDGLIEGLYYFAGDFSCETANFWNDFDSTQFPGVSPSCASNNQSQAYTNGANKNVPLSKLGKAGSFFIASANALNDGSKAPDTTNPKNIYIILDGSQEQLPGVLTPTTAANNNSPVKPSDLLALDKKTDDGLADSGNVTAGSISGNTANPALNYGAMHNTPFDDAANNKCTVHSALASYDLTITDYTCTPAIRIGASAGDPQ